MREVPSFIKAQQELSPRGLIILGMSLDTSSAPVQRFHQAHGINYPILIANQKTVDDFGGIIGVPTSFLVNRSGIIVKKYQGYIDKETLYRDVERVLAQPAGQP